MYRAPVDEIVFTLRHVCGLGDLQKNPRHSELGDDLVDAIVNEAGRFAAEEIAPLNAVADKHGLSLAHMAMAFQRSRPFKVSAIFGATTSEQLAELLKGRDLELSDKVLADIDTTHRAHPMPY